MRDRIVRRKVRRMSIRKKISGTKIRPRVAVFRSNKSVYVQVIDDDSAKTLYGCSEKGIEAAKEKTKWFGVGEKIGKKLNELKIESIVFDRGGYRYIGRVKDIAEGIRSKNINF
ncbi:MAG TPA: 50S ribosomal protein L18 [Candidatus Dojkabacteria bacterium]|nr:50S ribosomal protein L18 [Candidatus Dojkabacteria bacterium]HQF36602.1 50S ribosomal protein L18 [Candidatus Dojkabacteria bacterium]